MNKGADFLPLEGIDYIEFYVGNARFALHYFSIGLGFDVKAYCGLETGVRDRYSYVLGQNGTRFLITAPIMAEHSISDQLMLHGDGVKDIALRVRDVDSAYHETTKRGAKGVLEPLTIEDDKGFIRKAAIATYGDTIHTFIDRSNYQGDFAPGFRKLDKPAPKPVGLKGIDHVVGNVELGMMERWVEFYKNVMGFSQLIHYDDKDISTQYSALMSKVMQDGTTRIKFPINEPAPGKRKSQIQEYLDYYNGPGVQHIALSTENIIKSVSALRKAEIEFLWVPESYYGTLLDRVAPINEPLDDLKKLKILVDRDDEGYLLQIFTKTICDRPTLFFEIIQRKGSRSFGKGNFKALFEAIEREQAARGNL